MTHRNYPDETSQIYKTYKDMHENQTLSFVLEQKLRYGRLNNIELTIEEAIRYLDKIVDESDPDTDYPNSVHAFQTAEKIREEYPELEWLQLVGLIHDIGKILILFGEPQWSVVGDTFPVGCKFSDKCIYPETFKNNPDNDNDKYNTKFGIYKINCGFDNVHMSYGHDEYMYQVLKNNKNVKLPEKALYIIRYHSFYPFHTDGEYRWMMNDYDRSMEEWINEFNKYDLYSKTKEKPDIKKILPYYQYLIDKYIPGKLKF